jgi:hypothetical protein
MPSSKAILNLFFFKYNIITSTILHIILIVFAINFYNSNKQLPSESYKIIEIDFFSQITNEKKIKTVSPLEKKKPSEKIEKKSALDQEEKSLIPEKEVKNKIPRETESSQKKNKTQDYTFKQDENLINKKPKVHNKIQSNDTSLEKKKSLSSSSEDEKKYEKLFNDYKIYLKNTIQREASKNYPITSLRKKEEGNVEVIFTLDSEGFIKLVSAGNKTNASKRLVDSLTKVLKNKIVKFEKSEILKKTNTFSIIIVYKLK